MNILPRVFIAVSLFLIGNSDAIAESRVYSLQDAYESAYKSYEGIKIAEEGVVQAETRVDQAMTYLYPRLTGQASYLRYNEVLPPGESDFIFQPLRQFTAGLVLNQPLYTGGRTLAALRTAKTLREASKEDLTATRQETMLSVAEAYYGVLKAQKLVEVSRDSLARMERHKRITDREAATRRSKANASALLRANTLVSQAKITLVVSEDALKIARERLMMLTGLPINALFSEPPHYEPPAEKLEQLRDIALANRSEYSVSKLNQSVAKENIAIVRGAHYPQLFAEGALQRVDSNPATLLDDTIYYGGVRLQIPIFEGGLMKAEVSEARSKLKQAAYSTALLRKSIETEVHKSYIDLQSVSFVRETTKGQYDDARKNFSTVEGLFSEGLTSSLAVIDAQQALFIAEREFVNAAYDQQLAIIRLQRVTGVLGKEGRKE